MGMAMYKYAGMFKRKCRLYGKSTSEEFWGDVGSIFAGVGNLSIDILTIGTSNAAKAAIAGI